MNKVAEDKLIRRDETNDPKLARGENLREQDISMIIDAD